MVTAELKHNTFLRTTEVTFNGKKPKLNSAIEKYDDKPLVEWASQVPKIFRDEMNGLDFDLPFSGTQADFQRLEAAFRAEGITDDQVRLSHKSTLASAPEKHEAILAFAEWLRERPNGYCKPDELLAKDADLLEGAFPYVILHGAVPREPMPLIAPESIDDISELQDTDLINVPILLCVTPASITTARKDVRTLVARKDVNDAQIFFYIHPSFDRDRILRSISDLGISGPKEVTTASDPAISSYVYDRPLTDAIFCCISNLTAEVKRIRATVDEKAARTVKSGALKQNAVDSLDEKMNSLEKFQNQITHRYESGKRQKFEEAKQDFNYAAQNWKARKTKVTESKYIYEAAVDYAHLLRREFDAFDLWCNSIAQDACESIRVELDAEYKKLHVDNSFEPITNKPVKRNPSLPDGLEGFFSKRRRIVKEDAFLGFLPLFNGEVDKNGQIEVETSFLEGWRNDAQSLFAPILSQFIKKLQEDIANYHNSLVEEYAQQAQRLIDEYEARKQETIKGMSYEEKHLQADIDWVGEFEDKLRDIEQG